MIASYTMKKLGVAIVGYGYFGPSLLRNFLMCPDVEVIGVCEKDPERLARVTQPHLVKTERVQDFLENPAVDAMVLAVPTEFHHTMAKASLLAGKHVWVEKPLTDSVSTAVELCLLAKEKKRKLFVDHTFVYNPAIQKMKDLIHAGELGHLYYFDITRVNLGLIQKDINVVWDLAPHDLATIHYLLDRGPETVSAFGVSPVTRGHEELAYINLRYADGMIAHLNFNWLSPVKIRRFIIGGSRKLLVYDDGESVEKIKIYDKGVDLNPDGSEEGAYRFRVNYRVGDMISPYVEHKEPLQMACRSFVAGILNNESTLADGVEGLRVIQVLEAIQKSLKSEGRFVAIDPIEELFKK